MRNKLFYKNKYSKSKYTNKSQHTLKYAANASPKSRKWLSVTIISCSIAIVIAICTTVLVTGISNNIFPFSSNVETVSTTKPTKPKKVYPEFKTTQNTAKISKKNPSRYIVVIDKQNDTILAQRNCHKRVYPASTTKTMTLLVAAENMKGKNGKFEMTFDITNELYIAEASVVGFSNGEKITIKDLMYGTILPSGADAAIGLSIKIAGSEKNFVKLMNEKVKDLGLKNTHFTNVTGLHHKNNYSSAYDMAIILDAAMKNDLCKKVLSTYQHTTAKTPQHPDGILITSTLFKYMYGTEPKTSTILGGKTGYLNESGYCIAAYGQANKTKNTYIVVTLGGPSRIATFNDQIKLFRKFAK